MLLQVTGDTLSSKLASSPLLDLIVRLDKYTVFSTAKNVLMLRESLSVFVYILYTVAAFSVVEFLHVATLTTILSSTRNPL